MIFPRNCYFYCDTEAEVKELLQMLEDDGLESSYICISDGTHTSWPAQSFFRRGSSTINEGDMELYSTPIEFEDFLPPVSVDIGDLL